MKLKIAIVASILFSLSVIGQKSIDILTISGYYGFPQSYEETYDGKAAETGIMVSLVAPIKFSEKTIWYNNVNYFYWNVSNDETMPSDITNPIKVQGIMFSTGLYQKFANDNGIQLIITPRLMTDFKNVNISHFQLGGTVLYEKKYHDKLTMSFGALYNQEYFGAYFVPLVKLDWQFSDRWSISGLLPVHSKVKYTVNENFNFGINHFGLVTSYRLGDINYSGDYMERKSIDVGLFARHRISGNFHLEARFGYAFSRSYSQYAKDQKVSFSIPLVSFNDNRTKKNTTYKDGSYANLRVVYALPL